MWAKCVVGHDGFGNEIGPLEFYSLVHVVAVVAVRPAIESSVLHVSHVIGNEIAAELVALVDGNPKCSCVRLPGEADRIARTGSEDAVCAGDRIDLPDRGATFFRVDSILSDVAVRTDADVELRAGWIRNETLGPVMVDSSAREGRPP